MLNSQLSGAETSPVRGAIPYGGFGRQQSVESVAESTGFQPLLEALFDAHRDGRGQTARDLRDQLNSLRETLGDQKLKEVFDRLIETAMEKFREFLRELFRQWFPKDDVGPPGPGPVVPPGGGRRGRATRNDFPSGEVMSNKPLTEGSQYFNYTPDNSNPGKKPESIWSGFSQGPDGNCITVSAIKAAMMQFGQKPTDVFKEVKENGDGYSVTMRDGFKLYVSKGELELAATQARFKGDDPAMLTDANFMYAVSAKRAQMENNDGTASRSYSAALRSLNDGELPREGLDRLGLRNHYRQGTHADLSAGAIGTVEYNRHSMAVINNQVELWGKRGGAPQPGIVTILF